MPSAVTASNQPKGRAQTRALWRYIFAVAIVLVFGAFQEWLVSAFALRLTYLMFFPAIMLSAWVGGGRAAVVATGLSALLAYLFFVEQFAAGASRASQLWTMFIFISEGLFIAALGEARQQSSQALIEERNLLEARVVERTREITQANAQLAEQIAERELAQAALLESESKFRSVVQTASDAIVMSDAEGRLIFWNRGAGEIFGYSDEEALNQPVTMLIPQEYQSAHNSAMRRLQAGEEPRILGRTVELRGRRKGGSEFPIELSLAGWRMGEKQFYSGIMRDLTARKQAEEDRVRLIEELSARAELEAAEQRYRLLAEAIPQIVWTAMPDGAVDYFNQHWFDYSGLSQGQSIAWSWQAILHPDDIEETLARWKNAVAVGGDYEVEYRFRRHDGTYRWHLGRGIPLRDENGRIFKWFGTCTDIDEQKRSGEASRFLAQAGSQLAAQLDEDAILQALVQLCVPTLGDYCFIHLIEALPEERPVISLSRLEEPPVLLRAAQAAPSQWQEAQAVDTKRFEFPAQTSPDRNGATGAGKSATEKSIEEEIIIGPWRALTQCHAERFEGAAQIEPLTRPGALLESLRNVPVHTVLCVPMIARGRVLGVLTLAATAHALDGIATVTVEDLARNAALMVDNARLLREMQDINRAKDEFLAVLSHELRTPLTAILGWVQLLQSETLEVATQKRAFETIERNTKAQTQLIEDLLDLSRIITGKLRLETRSLDLAPIIEAAVDAIRPAAHAKEIEVFVSLAPRAGVVMGDANRLQQVMWNLLSNAIKFTPQGGRVEASLRRVDNSLEIIVRDNGQGIKKEFQPHVFDRFRQADSSSTRRYGGLGLGLAIVRHVVELHGGTARVESPGDGQGSTFALMLPVAPRLVEPLEISDGSPYNVEVAEAKKAPRAHRADLLEGVRVLLVDDERDARDMLRAVLERYGAQVCACGSVPEALDAFPSWRPRVIVSDIGMPTQDGYDLIRQVRALPQEEGGMVPAMALTAYARSSDREQALEAGFNRHIVKPVDPASLAAQVAELACNGKP